MSSGPEVGYADYHSTPISLESNLDGVVRNVLERLPPNLVKSPDNFYIGRLCALAWSAFLAKREGHFFDYLFDRSLSYFETMISLREQGLLK